MEQTAGLEASTDRGNWLRGLDLNQRPSGYEPDELPDCSTPRREYADWEGEIKLKVRFARTFPRLVLRPFRTRESQNQRSGEEEGFMPPSRTAASLKASFV